MGWSPVVETAGRFQKIMDWISYINYTDLRQIFCFLGFKNFFGNSLVLQETRQMWFQTLRSPPPLLFFLFISFSIFHVFLVAFDLSGNNNDLKNI